MTHEVATIGRATQRTAIATAISVLISVPMTFLAMTFVFGVDPDAMITVSVAFKFGLAIAAAAPALICPIVSYKISLANGERDRALVELRHIAQIDQLTGLLNRRGFDAAAVTVVAECDANHKSMSVLMLDIDFFKSINDHFGHEFGDAALVRVGAILRDTANEGGFIVGRQGGEEFIALLPGAHERDAVAIAESLRKSFSETPIIHKGKSSSIAVSIGVASRKQSMSSLSKLVSEADIALYSAKRGGRNRVVLHRPTLELVNVA